MPGRVSQSRREREQHASGSRRAGIEESDQVDELHEERRRKRRKRLTEMNADDLFEEQDPKEKAETSAGFRNLQSEADDLRANAANTTVMQLAEAMQKSEILFRNVRDPALASLDARVMTTTVDTALDIARKMKLDTNAFNIDEFLIRMKGVLGLDREELQDQDVSDEEDELADPQEVRGGRRQAARKGRLGDWEKVGWMAAKLYRRVPGVEFMYGPIGTAPRKRMVQNRQKRAPVEAEIRPQEIVSQQAGPKAPKDDLMTHVKRIGKILQRVDPSGDGINFFRLVINPSDFGQTVENCFFVSFLLKDGLAGIQVSDDGEVMIFARTPHNEDGNDINVAKNQAVMELTMETWEEAKRIFDISDSVVPTRTQPAPAPLNGNNWYT